MILYPFHMWRLKKGHMPRKAEDLYHFAWDLAGARIREKALP